jgi:hypothetical protein
MTDLPNPLTPADCDLRDFQYMPLDVQRLCDSDLAALESPEACWAALLLWSKSWHQVPAASLPDDDRVLAKFTGYQRAPDAWKAIREGALRGWVKCADGRLYHAVVAEKANEAWFAKHRLSHDKLCERIRKRNRGRPENGLVPLEVPELERWIDAGRPLERALFPEEFSTTSGGTDNSFCGTGSASGGSIDKIQGNENGIPAENALKGKGTEGIGNGEGEVNLKTNGRTGDSGKPAHDPGDTPLTPVAVSVALIGWERERHKAARGISASNVQVIELAELSVTDAELRRAYDAAVADRLATGDPNPVNAGFVKTFVLKHRNPPRPRPKLDGWSRSESGIRRKASELGMPVRTGESWEQLKGRLWEEVRRREREGAAA